MRGAALLLPLLCAATAADDIVFASGTAERDVKVLEQTAETIVFVGRSLKPTTFPAKMVSRVERKRSTIHEYDERSAAAKDAGAVMALAAWAKEKAFSKSVIEALHQRALALDPGHPAANEAVGRVLHEGAWRTPEERDRLVKEAEEAAMKAKGLVRHGDGWVTPEEKEKLDQGLRLHDGRWMTEDQIKEAEGFVQHEGRWVKKQDLEVLALLGPARKGTGLGDELKLVQNEHYAVLGDLSDTELQTLAAMMEKLYQEWVRILPAAEKEGLLQGKHRLYVFKKNPPYLKLVRFLYEQEKREGRWSQTYAKAEEERMKLRQRETSFWITEPHPMSAHVQMPDPFEGLKSHCAHFGANVLATRCVNRYRFPTWWVNEGLAYYLELRVAGTIQTHNADVGGGKYADGGPLENNKGDPWQDATKWTALLLHLVQSGRDPPLDAIKGKDLFSHKNRLSAQDLAKSWSVVTYLVEDDPAKFRAFFADAKGSGEGSAVERETSAAIKHYGGYARIEEGWRKYALNNFRVVR
ncbi:MAG: hypothetical protein ACREID_00075 [Planctomycetota bacterium]